MHHLPMALLVSLLARGTGAYLSDADEHCTVDKRCRAAPERGDTFVPGDPHSAVKDALVVASAFDWHLRVVGHAHQRYLHVDAPDATAV
jgi:hypothetical protein